MPPGSAKSTYASVLFPPWYMQFDGGANVLAASHTTELAEKWGRRIRNLIAEHPFDLGVELAQDSQEAVSSTPLALERALRDSARNWELLTIRSGQDRTRTRS